MKTLREAILKEALFSRRNIKSKSLNISGKSGTLLVEIIKDKVSFNYNGIHFGVNCNITIVISIEDAKIVIGDLGIKRYKAGKTVKDVDNKDSYIYCDPSGKSLILGYRALSYDVVFWLDQEQIKELKELFK